VDDQGVLGDLLHRSTAVLLDFDGPVCDVFAVHPPGAVADELAAMLNNRGVALPRNDVRTLDPLDLLEWVAEACPHWLPDAETVVTAGEITAATTAPPTPGSGAFLEACDATGHPVAVVSNNAGGAVTAHLERRGLRHLVRHVQGRDPSDPRLMKPDPHAVHAALAALGRAPSEAVLIGDSRADVAAGQAAGVPVIGYLSRPGRAGQFTGADALTTSLQLLAELLLRSV
jgi:phosphoglycolate phosphatase